MTTNWNNPQDITNFAKDQINSMFGPNAYENRVAAIQNVANLKEQLKQAQSDYNARLKAHQQSVKQAQTQAKKKTYVDAVDQLAANPSLIRQGGAYKTAEEIKNDPSLQAKIKAQGYNVSDYINALYNVASNGKFRSEREFNQYNKQLKADIKKKNAPNQAINDAVATAHNVSQSKNSTPSHPGLLGMIGNEFNTLKNDAGQVISALLHPTSAQANNKALSNIKKNGDVANSEAQRFANRTVDSASFGAFGKLDNAAHGGKTQSYQSSQGRTGVGKAADVVSSLLGDLVPGGVIFDGVKGLKTASRAEQALKNIGFDSKIAKLGGIAAQGAAAGGLYGVAQQGTDAALNPGSQPLSTRIGNVGMDAIFGAGADLGLHGIGQFFKSISKSAPKEVSQQLLALPEPQKALPEPLKGLPEPLTINQHLEPNKAIQGVKKVTTKNSYPAKFEKLVSDFNKLQAEGKITPGREYEIAKEMWSHMAGPKDPSFENLLKLANDNTKKVYSPQEQASLMKLARKNQNAAVYGVDNILQHLPKNQGGTVKVPLSYVGKNTQPLKQLSKQVLDAQNSPQSGLERLVSSLGQVGGKNAQRAQNEALNASSLLDGNNKALNISEAPTKQSDPGLVKADSKTPTKPQINVNASEMKDLRPMQIYGQDPYRNFRQVMKSAAEPFLNKLDQAKGNFVQMQHDYLGKLMDEVVNKLGIKKDSKESALVQKYGEGQITLEELKQASPNKWKDIVKADQWFRQAYGTLLDQVNKVRSELYPNNPDKLVPKRDNYYRHFNELNGLDAIRNLFDGPSGIDPHLVGTSEFTSPNSKFAGFMQKRGLGKFKNDAVGGFLNYLPAASYATHIDPQIKMFRQLKNALADQTGKTKHLNNFLNFLDAFSNDLAGKTNPADRFVQNMFGRKTFNVLNTINRRVKANLILGNVGSSISQLANIPQGIAFGKQYAIKGAGNTLLSIFHETPAMQKSTFLKERYGQQMYRKFDQKILHQPKKFAEWMMETADKIGTKFIWNSAYEKGLAQDVKDPVKFADNATRDLVAGRGIGEVPLLQKSKLVQLLAPFQLEVGNLWRVQKDFVKNKDFGALATFFVAAYLMNQGFKKVKGSGVIFDPIGAMVDAATEKDLTPLERVGRLGGEVLSNVPFGQTLANLYPTYGNKTLPTRQQLFGRNDPNRFGSGLLIASTIKDPLFKFAPNWGGNQAEKMWKGFQAIQKQGVYKGNQLEYPVSNDPLNALKAVLLGPSALKEAQTYYGDNRRPLSAKQTQQYEAQKSVGKGDQFYNQLMLNREANTLETRLKKVMKDKTLTPNQKQKQFNDLVNRLSNLKQANTH